MNTRPILASLCAALGLISSATAQTQQRYYPQTPGSYPQPQYTQPAPPPNYQQPYQPAPPQGYGYPQQQQTQYENPIQFLPKFGKRMSEVVRRIFYGQDPTGYDNPPPNYGPNGGYSLDSAPRQNQVPNYPQQPQAQPGYQYPQQPQAQPRYNYPPQPSAPQNKGTTPVPSTQGKSSSTRTYTPPKVADSPAKTPSRPATTARPKQPEPIAPPPPPTTTRRSESAPQEQPSTASSSGSGSFLKGKKTAKPGRVISPYPPYKELDITGLESGSLALDPTTQKVFEVP